MVADKRTNDQLLAEIEQLRNELAVTRNMGGQKVPLLATDFKTLIEQSPVSTQIFAPDGKTLYVNPAWEKLWGVPLEALADYNVLKDQQLIDGGLMPFVENAFHGELTRVPVSLYDTNMTENVSGGTGKRWVSVVMYPVKDTQGDIREVVFIHEDVTVAKEALLESEEKYRGIFDESVASIYVFDPEKNFIDANQAGLDLLGYSREELLNMSISDVDADHGAVVPAHDQLLSGGRIVNFEHRLVHKDGRIVTVLNNSRPLTDSKGDVMGMQSTLIDITERKEAEAVQARLQRELHQSRKMESLGHLTGGIAHDFNNLLHIIAGFSDLSLHISTGMDNPKLTKYLNRLKNATQRATSLVAQMLSFSRMDQAGSVPMEIAPVLREEIELLRASLPSTIELDVEIDEKLPAVLMNPIQLQQMLMNLCINARDAMDGQGKLTLELGWAKNLKTESSVSHKTIRGDWIKLVITDTGSGIDPDIIDEIFTPFFTTKEIGEGTGMGLAVVYGIMEKHGGHILIESGMGQGTSLCLLFSPHEEEVCLPDDTDSNDDGLSTGHGENILVVDDEENIVELLDEVLVMYGYQPTIATDSIEALTLFKKHPGRFAMLITDQTMPKLTGWQLIEKVREIQPDLPVILCSGFSDKVDIEEARIQNIHYFDKPVDFNKLQKEIVLLLYGDSHEAPAED